MSSKVFAVPIDFSQLSLNGLEFASRLAKTLEGELLLIHVVEGEPFWKLGIGSDAIKELRSIMEKRLEGLAEREQKENGISVRWALGQGKVYTEISRIAHEHKARFIVMGTNGEDTFVQRLMGSNTARVIRESALPVVSVSDPLPATTCKRVVLPLDLTKESRQKVKLAADWALKFQSEIKVVSVMEMHDEFVKHTLQRQMDQVCHFLQEKNIPFTSEFVEKEGTIARTILEYCYTHGADILIIMTQQQEDIIDFFIGSSAEEIINYSRIPVLSLPPRDLERHTGSIIGT
ncbi:MAG: universal stress protein [Flavobacteriales bacterium]|nr:universal stress protein [Flavobacteriales bacterium]MCX7768056.1 universal stress protein [Flavobacteriales bacterium]MDW8409261.1 universal stress protein [Flavobacteriales bacterium]